MQCVRTCVQAITQLLERTVVYVDVRSRYEERLWLRPLFLYTRHVLPIHPT